MQASGQLARPHTPVPAPASRLVPGPPVSFGSTEVSRMALGSPGGFSMAAFMVLGRSSSHCRGRQGRGLFLGGKMVWSEGTGLLLLLPAAAAVCHETGRQPVARVTLLGAVRHRGCPPGAPPVCAAAPPARARGRCHAAAGGPVRGRPASPSPGPCKWAEGRCHSKPG